MHIEWFKSQKKENGELYFVVNGVGCTVEEFAIVAKIEISDLIDKVDEKNSRINELEYTIEILMGIKESHKTMGRKYCVSDRRCNCNRTEMKG